MGNGRRRLGVEKPCERAARRGPAPALPGSGLERGRRATRRRRAGLRAATIGCAAALAACGGGDGDLVTLDRVGKEDAKNSFTLEMNADFSPQAAVPEQAKGFRDLFARWARRHPQWRVDLNIIPAPRAPEQARLLEKARVGRAPDCASVDSFTLPLFIQPEGAHADRPLLDQGRAHDLLPFVRDVMTGPDGHLYAYWW